jgi:hypothetical protein
LSILALLLAACLPQTAVLPGEAPGETAVAVTATTTPLPWPSPTAAATGISENPRPSATMGVEMPEEPTALPPSPSALPPAAQEWVNQAITDLAQRTGLPLEEIEFLSFELREWSDSSLGCPQPGMMYAQVPQDGYLIQLRVDEQVYNYHGSGDTPFLCEQQPPLKITKQPPLTLKGTPTISVPPPRD